MGVFEAFEEGEVVQLSVEEKGNIGFYT